MPHRVLGVDLGGWSVNVAELEAGFRATRVIGFHERRVDAARPWPDGAIEALAALRADLGLAADAVCVAMPGDRVLVHALTLPFDDPRKIASVAGYEMESQIPWDLADVCFDFAVAGRAPAGEGSLVVAAAARREEVIGLLGRLHGIGVDPQAVVPSPFAYAAFREAEGEVVAWIDAGHRRTNLCVLAGGAPRFERAISHGGDDVTRAIAAAYRVSYEDAEAFKHGAELDARSSSVVAGALAPLLRDLRVSLEACRERAGAAPSRAVLCGGGARLPGFPDVIAQTLGLPVEIAGRDDRAAGGPLDAAPPEAVLALACALRAADKARLPNLRTGDLAWRGDVSVLRARLGTLAAAAVIVLGLAVASGFASLAVLRRERRQLEARLATDTRALFGQDVLDGVEVSRRLMGTGKTEGPPIPEKTAFDLMTDLSERTPPATDLRIDISELDVRPKKTFVKAATDSAAAVDALVDAWKKSECVAEVQKGPVKDAAGGQEKQFTLTVDTRCF